MQKKVEDYVETADQLPHSSQKVGGAGPPSPALPPCAPELPVDEKSLSGNLGNLVCFSHYSLRRHLKPILTPTPIPLLFPGTDWTGLLGGCAVGPQGPSLVVLAGLRRYLQSVYVKSGRDGRNELNNKNKCVSFQHASHVDLNVLHVN